MSTNETAPPTEQAAAAPPATNSSSTEAQKSSEFEKRFQEQNKQMEELKAQLAAKAEVEKSLQEKTNEYKKAYDAAEESKRMEIEEKINLLAMGAHKAHALQNLQMYRERYEGQGLSDDQLIEIAMKETPDMKNKFRAFATQAQTNPEMKETLSTLVSAYTAQKQESSVATSAKEKEIEALRAKVAALEGKTDELADEKAQLAGEASRMADHVLTQANAAYRGLQKQDNHSVESRKRPRGPDDAWAEIESGRQVWLTATYASPQYPGSKVDQSPRVTLEHLDRFASRGMPEGPMAERVRKSFRISAYALPPQEPLEAPAGYVHRIGMAAAIGDAMSMGNTSSSGFGDASESVIGRAFVNDPRGSGKVIVKEIPTELRSRLPDGFNMKAGEARRAALGRVLGTLGASLETVD